jgi:hypothetical protein
MKKVRFWKSLLLFVPGIYCQAVFSQHITDTAWQHAKKNIVRYNISGALFFGFDKYVIVGYERLVNPHQSFSVNVGAVKFPKFVNVETDSFKLSRDIKNSGFNVSADYRFYLKKENKNMSPHGVYIGPFYSYNHFLRENKWDMKSRPGEATITNSKFNIHTVGAELGYQFLFWKKMAVDVVMVGPGISSYWLQAKVEGNVGDGGRTQLQDAVKQLIQQKFPGMNYIMADQEFKGNGVINTWAVGYRYMIHIGYYF